jgi:hypothetical protein
MGPSRKQLTQSGFTEKIQSVRSNPTLSFSSSFSGSMLSLQFLNSLSSKEGVSTGKRVHFDKTTFFHSENRDKITIKCICDGETLPPPSTPSLTAFHIAHRRLGVHRGGAALQHPERCHSDSREEQAAGCLPCVQRIPDSSTHARSLFPSDNAEVCIGDCRGWEKTISSSRWRTTAVSNPSSSTLHLSAFLPFLHGHA